MAKFTTVNPVQQKFFFGQHQASRGGPFFFVLAGEVMPEKPVVLEDGLETGCAGCAKGVLVAPRSFLAVVGPDKYPTSRW